MKRILLLMLLLLCISCDDGDFDIASFEFEDKVNVCGSYTLYRLSTNGQQEALIVTLSALQIRNDEEPVVPVSVSENGPYTVTDRVFASQVTSSYFCAAVPPTEPEVTRDWRGVSGWIIVENRPVYDANQENIVSWEHIVVLNDVVLKSGEESIVFNDTYLFGTFTTSN